MSVKEFLDWVTTVERLAQSRGGRRRHWAEALDKVKVRGGKLDIGIYLFVS